MAIVVPKGRKHRAARALFAQVRSRFGTIPDDCQRDPESTLTDALMAALAIFSPKVPSLLAFDDTSDCLRAEIYKACPC